MQQHSKEFTYTLRPDNIVEINPHKDFDGDFSLEEIDNNLAAFEKVKNDKIVGSLIDLTGISVKKEVLKEYSDQDYGVIASALVTGSFNSKFLGNTFLAMALRFSLKKNIPTKVFKEKDAATEWLLEQLEKDK